MTDRKLLKCRANELEAVDKRTAELAGALGLKPWPYKAMDDRYLFCSGVGERAKGLESGPDGCTSYPQCDLTGDGPCAFDDSEFDWDRAAKYARSQPLIIPHEGGV